MPTANTLKRHSITTRSFGFRNLPSPGEPVEGVGGIGPIVIGGAYDHTGDYILSTIKEEVVGPEGMRIDRMFFRRFEETVREKQVIAASVEAGQWDRVIDYVNREVFDKSSEFYTLDKLRRAAAVNRRVTLRKILEKVFGGPAVAREPLPARFLLIRISTSTTPLSRRSVETNCLT